MEPRSLSAAFHRVSFSSFIVDATGSPVGAFFALGGMVMSFRCFTCWC